MVIGISNKFKLVYDMPVFTLHKNPTLSLETCPDLNEECPPYPTWFLFKNHLTLNPEASAFPEFFKRALTVTSCPK